MSDAQALSRWIAREIARLRDDPEKGAMRFGIKSEDIARYIEAISRMSVHDAIRLFAFTLITGDTLPDLDAIKEGEA